MSQYFVKTDEADTVKKTIEVLQNNFTDVCFEFGAEGIRLVAVDKKEPYTKLADLKWSKDNFDEFKCVKSANVGVNLQHFYKLLKTIKKKDRISLELLKDKPRKLIINKIINGYQPSDSELQYQHRQLIFVDMDDSYKNPILLTTANFQRACKEINNLSKVTTITAKNGYINFSCFVDGMFQHNVPFGDPDVETEEEYEDTFDTKTLMGLIKISSLTEKMHIYTSVGKPLKISVKTGFLGTLDFYIRSRSMISDDKVV
jgi:hypothetical protein